MYDTPPDQPAGLVSEMLLLSACIKRDTVWLPSQPSLKHITEVFENLKLLTVGTTSTFYVELLKII